MDLRERRVGDVVVERPLAARPLPRRDATLDTHALRRGAPGLRERSDAGEPLVATEPDSPHAKVYRDIARQVLAALGGSSGAKPPPAIVIE